MTLPLEVAAPTHAGPLLAGFEIYELFGRYDYSVEVPGEGRLLLLHGENGSGKTTLLRLLWNLLSPADNRGHRSNLARTPFSRFHVRFRDGITIDVRKVRGLLGSFDVTVQQPRQADIVAQFEADDTLTVRPQGGLKSQLIAGLTDEWQVLRRHAESADDDHAEFHDFIRNSEINPLLLADDRSLYSDDEDLERARERLVEDRPRVEPTASDSVGRELRLTIRRVNDLLRSLTLRGQTSASASANAIYLDVLHRLAGEEPSVALDDAAATATRRHSIEKLLHDLEVRSSRYEEYGLVPPFSASEFAGLLRGVGPDRLDVAYGILSPYLDSLSAGYDALEEAERVLRALITLANRFFRNKSLRFSPRAGLQIFTSDETELDPTSLSSGERQLTMLLCTTLLAGRGSRLFIIDEPELSLGAEWQRAIIDALLDLTRDTSLQFIVATHSIEVISGHATALVSLHH